MEPLGAKHHRAAFSCGVMPLDKYLQTQASQDMKKNLTAVYVLTTDGKTIVGYYTLSAYSVRLDQIPDALARKLTPMPEVPATLLGRLARSSEFQGQAIGEILLTDALKRSLANSKHVGSWTVIVDAKDTNAAAFSKTYGFGDLPGTPRSSLLANEAIGKLALREFSSISET